MREWLALGIAAVPAAVALGWLALEPRHEEPRRAGW